MLYLLKVYRLTSCSVASRADSDVVRYIDYVRRLDIFQAYYSLDAGEKDVYLFGCMRGSKPKMLLSDTERHREISVSYVLRNDEMDVRLCKKAFMKLHNISQSKVDHIVSQGKLGLPTARSSFRGKHTNRPNKLSDERRQLVHEHIMMFPAESSHFSRHDNPNRLYLPATLSINAMYVDYEASIELKQMLPVSCCMYRQIFCNDFNLGFGSPRTDTCSRCEVMTGELLASHKEKAEAAFEVQKLDRVAAKNGNAIYITFDLQQTLPLPRLAVSDAFYLRQLWLYNTGVHLISQHKEGAYSQIWTELEGRRGVKEVCSSLYAFFTVSNIADCGMPLIAWSDSCAGQNKNHKILCFWQYLLLTQMFQSIEHKFPMPGHSFLDSDRDFAKIEVAVKRRENIYSVDEYQQIMSNCIKQPKPTVTRIGDKMFDIDKLIKQMGLKKNTVDIDGTKIEMRDKVRWIKILQFGIYQYRHSFSEDEPWKEVRMCNDRGITPPVIELLPLSRVPIATPKLNDIKKQLKFIPTIMDFILL